MPGKKYYPSYRHGGFRGIGGIEDQRTPEWMQNLREDIGERRVPRLQAGGWSGGRPPQYAGQSPPGVVPPGRGQIGQAPAGGVGGGGWGVGGGQQQPMGGGGYQQLQRYASQQPQMGQQAMMSPRTYGQPVGGLPGIQANRFQQSMAARAPVAGSLPRFQAGGGLPPQYAGTEPPGVAPPGGSTNVGATTATSAVSPPGEMDSSVTDFLADGSDMGAPAGGTQVTSTYLSPEVAEQYAGLTSRIETEGQREYQPYGAPRLAGFTEAEAAAQAGTTAYGKGLGPAATQQAAATLAAGPGRTTDIDPRTGKSVLDPYMSQYTQGVIDPQIRAIQQQAAQQQSLLGSTAAGSGAFGGYRHGLGEQAIGQDVRQQVADVTAAGQQQAFQQAQTAYEEDRTAREAATGQQMTLGTQEQQMQYERLRQMEDAGRRQRALQQQSLGIGYQDWQNQMNQDRENINWQLGAMGGLPYQSTVATSAYTPQPSAAGAIGGAAIQGLDIYRWLQQQGAGSGQPMGLQHLNTEIPPAGQLTRKPPITLPDVTPLNSGVRPPS